MDENQNAREGIEAADATGMVANQELLATFPAESLRGSLPASHAAHESIDRLQSELGKPAPNRSTVERHVSALRSVRELEATIANWWDSPAIQQVVLSLTEIGL